MQAVQQAAINWRDVGVIMGFIVIWSGVMLWAAKRIIAGLETKLDGHIGEFKALQSDLTELKISLPRDYVRREDWIRFGVGIDAKLDRVHDRLDEMKARTQ